MQEDGDKVAARSAVFVLQTLKLFYIVVRWIQGSDGLSWTHRAVPSYLKGSSRFTF